MPERTGRLQVILFALIAAALLVCIASIVMGWPFWLLVEGIVYGLIVAAPILLVGLMVLLCLRIARRTK